MVTRSLLMAIQIASHLAYMVMLPLAIFGGLGLYLDRQFGTLPRYLLIGIGVAFILTTYWIVRRLRAIVASTLNEKQ